MSSFASFQRRFAAFSLVGAMGLAVQLAVLWLLTQFFGFHYLAATIVATELAILVNFGGHRSWTWSDRPSEAQEALRRLGRFHGANGLISLLGGAILMPLLVETAGVHYMLANVLTVGLCAAANFLAADRIVFRPAALVALSLIAAGATGPGTAALEAAELRGETLDAFDRYVRLTESRMENEHASRAPFLWMNRLPDAERQRAQTRMLGGDVVISRLETFEAGREIAVPGGLIHHWVGTTFVPRSSLDSVVALMQAYDRYQDVYAPNVRRSRLVRRDGDRFTASLQLFMKKVISVVLNTDNDVLYRRLDDRRVVVRSYSTRIAEVQNAGAAHETEAPVGHDGGYLWRFNNYCSLEQRPDGPAGTYVQCESLSLSRAVPVGLGWLVEPFVTSIPRESLEFTLGRIRKHLTSAAP